ncbi:MAG TPA: PEP-CTERM system TPR-repeat protein PrsT [Gammaproteobacteria bacterium]|nr:PEP-CTERM system TPR-repeat protein PrsT [Gammaproteobacteria bacterium]
MRTENILAKFVTSALMLIVVGVLVACSPAVNDKKLVQSAKSYMAENQVRAAAIELKNALQANPKNAEARYLLGKISLQTGDLASAEKEFQRALQMGWSAEAALTGKMRALVAQKKYKEMLEITDSTTEWAVAGQANFLALKAMAFLGQGDMQSAKRNLSSAAKLDADAYDVLKTRLLLQLVERKNKDAELTLARALKLYPDDSELMLLGAGLAAANKQNEEATRYYKKVIKISPVNVMTLNSRRAYLGLLKLAVLAKDSEQIKKLREVFVASKINDPEVNYVLAVAAFDEKNFDMAEEYLQKILKVSSSNGPTLLLSGSVSFAKQDFEKAAYYLSKYVVNYPENNGARKLLGRAYMALGQSNNAMTEFNTALNDSADDAELVALVGLSEISGGQLQSGILELEKALAMVPDSREVKLQLAKAYVADGQIDKAIKQLDDILKTNSHDNEIKKVKVLAYLQGKRIEMAMNTARKMLAESPDNPDVLFLMGSIQVAARDLPSARKYFNRALALNADHIESEMSLARLDEQQGDIASAEKRYQSIIDKKPDNISAMIRLARLAAERKDVARQIKWLKAAGKADEKDLFSRVALTEIYLKEKNFAEAEVMIKELEDAFSDTPAVLFIKSRLLMAKKRYTQAEAVILELIDVMPELDVAYYLQAENQLALGDEKSALKSMRKAYSLKPNVPRNIYLLARIELKMGNHARVMRLAEEIIQIAPDSAIGYVLKGDSLLAAGKFQQALANFDKAWANTKSRDIALRRFKLVRRLSGVEKAAPVLTGWLEKQPDDVGVMLELAKAYFVERHNNKAAIYFEKVLKMQPENIIALNNIAWLYGLEDAVRALPPARKAYKLRPELPGIIDTYGWILLKNNEITEALPLLKQAVEKLPENSEVQYHYAKALFIAGDTTAARKILKPLVASGKAFDGRDDAELMLTQE